MPFPNSPRSFLGEPEEQGPPSISLTPMVDVLFSILAFFIVSTLFLSRWQGLPVNLPEAREGAGLAPPEVTVTIQADGAIALDRQPVTLETLAAQVLEKRQDQKPLVVAINADEQVSHGQVVRVMDQLQRVPGIQLAIATQPTSNVDTP
ncbi:MAG: ExbD/TolR family protein [Cyanophyceae cyanobacterium]